LGLLKEGRILEMGGVEDEVKAVVNVMFGSATGNAEEIARRFHAELDGLGWHPGCIAPLNDFEAMKIGQNPSSSQNDYLIIVIATTGDGDLPTNALKFPRQVRKMTQKDSAALKGVNYAILGLGDSNYENFNNAAKRVDKILKTAGATSFCERAEADDGIGLELVIEPWQDAMFTYLKRKAPKKSLTLLPVNKTESTGKVGVEVEEKGATMETKQVTKVEGAGANVEELLAGLEGVPHALEALTMIEALANSAAPSGTCMSEAVRDDSVHRVAVRGCRLLTDKAYTERRVWHMELDLGAVDAQLKYEPGDSIGIVVENRKEDVTELLGRILLPDGAAGADSVCVLKSSSVNGEGGKTRAGPCSLRSMVSRLIDLNSPVKKTLLRSLANHCSEVNEAKALLTMCSKSGREIYSEKLRLEKLSILQLLRENPSCVPPLELLIDQVPPLAPRFYSAASASEVDASLFHFAFSVVQFEDGRRGLATGALEDICLQKMSSAGADAAHIEVLMRSHGSFAPPVDASAPYIMIGPGTGVAPFRGFLRQRRARGVAEEHGQTMLFFGCRHEDRDFLYREELEGFVADGTLSALVTAFSRDGNGAQAGGDETTASKVYVQHKMLEKTGEIGKLLAECESSRVYVCGDGGGMAAAVNDALVKILSDYGDGMTTDDAKKRLKEWASAGRYLRDVWFWGAL